MAQEIESVPTAHQSVDSELSKVSPKLSEQELKVAENLLLNEESYPEGFLLFNEYI